jgi:hypothetical protein
MASVTHSRLQPILLPFVRESAVEKSPVETPLDQLSRRMVTAPMPFPEIEIVDEPRRLGPLAALVIWSFVMALVDALAVVVIVELL